MNRRALSAQKRTTIMTNVETTETPATVAAPPRTARSKKAVSKKGATQKKGAARAKRAAKSAKPSKTAKPAKATAARAGTKSAKILALIGRTGGATLAAIMKATGWQAHSVRGFLSGTVGSKMGLSVSSVKGEHGGRTYSVKG
jgi:hypothetical protein